MPCQDWCMQSTTKMNNFPTMQFSTTNKHALWLPTGFRACKRKISIWRWRSNTWPAQIQFYDTFPISLRMPLYLVGLYNSYKVCTNVQYLQTQYSQTMRGSYQAFIVPEMLERNFIIKKLTDDYVLGTNYLFGLNTTSFFKIVD